VGKGEVSFMKGEEPGKLRVEIDGTVPVVEGKMCLGCVDIIRIGPNLKVATDPWFTDREHEGESVTLNLALEGPILADATEFIVSGPDGVTLRKEGQGFLLVEGEAFLLQIIATPTTRPTDTLTPTNTPTNAPTITPTSTPMPTPTSTPELGIPFSKEGAVEVPSISVSAGTGEVSFIKGKEPETLRIEVNGTVPVVEGKVCLWCLEIIRVDPNLSVPTEIFIEKSTDELASVEVIEGGVITHWQLETVTIDGQQYNVLKDPPVVDSMELDTAAFKIPIDPEATEFIVSGPKGATLRKEGRGFLLVEGEAYLLQTTTTPTLALPAASPTPALVAGWTLFENLAEGFAVALPPTWEEIALDQKTLEASLKVIKEQNPQIAAMLEGQVYDLIAFGCKFFGLDLAPEATATGFATNVNILKQSLGAEVSLDFYVQVNVGQLEKMANVVKPVSHRRVNLVAGEGEELQYRMNMALPTGETIAVSITQYAVIKGQDAYVVTLATTADQAERYAPIFEKIGQSFQWTDTPTSTRTDVPMSTPVLTPPPTPIALPTTTPIVVSPSHWPLILSDAFEANAYDWPTGSRSDEYATFKWPFTNGKYQWEVKAHQHVHWYVYPDDVKAVSDFYLTLETQQISGPDDSNYGVVFRTVDANNFYHFGITNTQEFVLFLKHRGEWATLIERTKTSAIQPGEKNRITVIAEGSHFDFFINDQFVAETDDGQLGSGKVGLAIELYNAGDEAIFEFDNFELRAP
jgi:hypothetical protein